MSTLSICHKELSFALLICDVSQEKRGSLLSKMSLIVLGIPFPLLWLPSASDCIKTSLCKVHIVTELLKRHVYGILFIIIGTRGKGIYQCGKRHPRV